jgi:phosphohistidine swiveling domain-containing protein
VPNRESQIYVRAFSEIRADDVAIVGGKGANLGEMTRAGLAVPPGFCLTAEAYRTFIASSHADETISQVLMGLRLDDPEDVEVRSEQIRNFLTAQQMNSEIAQEALRAYHQLGADLGSMDAPTPVAVRSSATAEDLPTASFAGQQDTYLNVRGDDALLEHIKRCWASLWTARAVAYRVKQGFDHRQVALAAVVQAMIQSEVSGVMFTANPVTGDRDEVVINASWGLGEAIVSGLVNPDTLTVRKSNGEILSRQIGAKERAVEYDAQGGTVEVASPPDRRDALSLTDAQVARLASLSVQIEAHYGAPMDIEWAYARGKFYILQARAITTLAPAGKALKPGLAKGEFNRTMFVEIFPDPLSPIFMSVIKPLFHSMLDFTFETWGFRAPQGFDAVGEFYSQPYFHREYIEAALRPLGRSARDAMVAQIVNPFGHQDRNLHGELSPHYVGMTLRLLRFMTDFPARLPKIVGRYRTEIREVEALQLDKGSDKQLVEHIGELVLGSASRLLNYDFLMIAMIGITYQMLGTLLERYFGKESERVRAGLISGVTGNVTMEANKRIWDLAQIVKSSPNLSAILRTNDRDVRQKLQEVPEGRAFLVELNGFLKEYGHREVRMDILYPTWGEDPSPILAFVRGYLDVDDSQDPHRQQQRLVQEREELARTVQGRVQSDLTGRYLVWPIFRWVLKHTQANTRERDTMHFELTRLFPPFRRLLLELGRRWAERGLVDQPSDVFFLELDELAQVADAPTPMRDLVEQRRAEFEASRAHGAPGIIRDGRAVEPESAASVEGTAGQWQGIAGSPGKVTGPVRVIRGPEEFNRLQTGDVLVAPLTNPVWTPLFAIAGGLVTEVGGILSHGAIVAREYGIPAVMAVTGATQAFKEGERLTVDGNQGLVYLDKPIAR